MAEVRIDDDLIGQKVKYHNKNIYGKLGVKSRKELLQCIKYMQLHENQTP